MMIKFTCNYVHNTRVYVSVHNVHHSDRDSSVSIATRYRLDGPWIESRWGRDFPQLSRPALGPTQPSLQWLQGL